GLADKVAVLPDGVTIIGSGVTSDPLIALASAGTTIYFNVKAYGAVGNGVTDDTTSIRNAQAAAFAAGGGTLYFPDAGPSYLISQHLSSAQCISLSSGVSMLGQSEDGAVLFLKANQGNSVRMVYVVAS